MTITTYIIKARKVETWKSTTDPEGSSPTHSVYKTYVLLNDKGKVLAEGDKADVTILAAEYNEKAMNKAIKKEKVSE